jgi:hypothetical protein
MGVNLLTVIENTSGLKIAAGLGVITLLNCDSMAMGRKGVLVVVGV